MDPKKVLNAHGFQVATGGSAIRAMFEEGNALRKIHGNEVLDFTLGNPSLEPPKALQDALVELATKPPPNLHLYMSNAGLPSARAAIARLVSGWYKVPLTQENLVLTVGAAGALVVLLRTLLEPGDEVILLSPYFVEYCSYIKCWGGVPVVVPTDAKFDPDLAAIKARITPRTRALFLNSPNNPTGHIYSDETLAALGKLLQEANADREKPIVIVSDEPYRRIAYDDVVVPSIIEHYPYTFVCTSFSKDLSIPGERLGFVVIPPALYSPEVFAALSTTQRQLGFVNAPSMIQFAVERAASASVDVNWYKARRDRLYQGLVDAGFELNKPEGAFYLFPKIPAPITEQEMLAALKRHLVLAVPGSGFGCPGYLRFAYCCSMEAVEKCLPRLKVALEEARKAAQERLAGGK